MDADRLRAGEGELTPTYRPVGACLDVGFFQNVLGDATMILPRAVFTEGGAFPIGLEFRGLFEELQGAWRAELARIMATGGRPHPPARLGAGSRASSAVDVETRARLTKLLVKD